MMRDFGTVIIDAYRTYNTSIKCIIDGFVGYGDPKLNFQFDENNQVLHLFVSGDCRASAMRERVRSIGHDLYLPFTKSLKKTEEILRQICLIFNIDNSFRPRSYSKPERNVTGFVEVPEIVAKYGYVVTMTPSFYWEPNSRRIFRSLHPKNYERLYVEWEKPKDKHVKWKETVWMKNEFHFGFRCMGFEETWNITPPSEDAVLDIRLQKNEIGHLSGLMTRMLADKNRI
jgi:hypothetical protein